MSCEILFIGDLSDEDKNKIYIKEPLDDHAVKFEKDGFTIKFERGVEIIQRENGIVIMVAQGKETPMNPVNDHCKCGEDVRNWTGDEPFNYCPNCGQKIDWEDEA